MVLVLGRFHVRFGAVAADHHQSGYGGRAAGCRRSDLIHKRLSADGGLPFTGLDLTLLLGGGLVLLMIGGSMWRLSRAKS